MFHTNMRIFLIIPVLVLVLVMTMPFSNAQSVPDWVKNTAGWWAEDAISETEFVNAIEFLVKDQIIKVETSQSTSNSQSVPDWVKNTAGWWAEDAISETEFVNAIEFLINVGIINVEKENQCVNDLLKYFNDEQEILQVCKEHDSSIHEELIPYKNKLKFNSEGFRGDEVSKEKSSDVYRIFVVGGSTILSADTSNETTIPSIFQKMLEIENPERKIEVINAGISGGNSKTELELIGSKIINYDPDLIIMYDGWNDLSTDYPVLKIINHYEGICSLAIENNFEVIHTLQPIAGFGSKVLSNQEKINSLTGQDHAGYQLIQARSTYDYLANEMIKLDEFVEKNFEGVCSVHDLRSTYDDVIGPIYWDQGHVLHAGNIIIAEKFFELSMKKIDSSFIPDEKFTKIISNYNSIPIIKFLLNQIEISNNQFDGEFRDIQKTSTDKGTYFHLKNKFEDASMSFVGKDLRYVDLENIDLRNKDLSGANLSGQDLRYVDLTNSVIRGANLSKTNLEGKDLSGMDLRGADFSFANLKNTNLFDTKISKPIQFMNDEQCNDPNDTVLHIMKTWICAIEVIKQEEVRTVFHNADFTNAKFGMTDPDETHVFYFVDFSDADFTNVELVDVTFAGNNFSNAKFNNVKGGMVVFVSSNLENVIIENFNFEIIWTQDSSLANGDLKNGVIDSAFFIDFNLKNTDLKGTKINELIEGGINNFECENHRICN